MKCPVCKDADLAMSDRQGVEIDFCPQCRGVWLDRGELDKLIERASRYERGHDGDRDHDDDDDDDRRRQYAAPPPPLPGGAYPPQQQPYPQQGYYPQKKRKSFWQEIFD